MKIKNQSILRLPLAGIAIMTFAFVCKSYAQDEEDEDIFLLSPYIVDSSEDSGYLATSTLAGTRLRTLLSDVGASVTVVTNDFLDDIGVNDLDFLTYTGGTETIGANGNFSNASTTENVGTAREERTNARPQQNTRIRGLARADTTQNFYLTNAPFDGFNIDRITINRGPNAALFGLGSPGGILDASLKRALMDDFGQIQVKLDNFGTTRVVLDLNKEIIEDKLAVRVAVLDETVKWEQEQAFEDDDRFYAAVTIQPFKNTTIRANYTNGEITAARPEVLPPRDGVAVWDALGRPLWDPFTSNYYRSLSDFNNGIPVDPATEQIWNNAFFGTLSGGANQPTALFGQHDSGEMGGPGIPDGAIFRIQNNANYRFYPGGTGVNNIQWRRPRLTRDLIDEPVSEGLPFALGLSNEERAFYFDKRVTDTGFFNYREQLAYGVNKFERNEFNSYSISLEQTFFDNKAGIEFGYYNEEFEDDLRRWGQDIAVDMNIRLPDGSMNPNLGRVYAHGNGFAEPEFWDQSAARVTAFGEYDFAEEFDNKFVTWLGRQVLTLFAGTQDTDFRRETHMPGIGGGELESIRRGIPINPRIRGGVNRLNIVSYYGGPSLLDINDLSTADLQAPTVAQIPTTTDNFHLWDATTAVNIRDANGNLAPGFNVWDGVTANTVRLVDHVTDPNETFTWGNSRQKSEVESMAAILQSYFLDGHIVTTASWRRDEVTLFTGTGGRRDDGTNLNIPNELPELTDEFSPGEVEQSAFSVVAHAPDFITEALNGIRLSAHYVKSENTDAKGGFIDFYGESIALSSGETDEYGFALRTEDGKLDLKFTWYENTSIGAIENPITRINNIERDILQNNTEAELAAAGFIPMDPGFLVANEIEPTGADRFSNNGVPLVEYNSRNPQQSQVQSTSDVVSEGMEVELTYNPLKNWRIHLNVSQVEAVQSNIAPAVERYFNERLDHFRDIGTQIWMTTGRVFLEQPGMPENPENRLVNPITGEFHTQVANQLATFNGAKANEGRPTQELREWRWNLITNYEFVDGPDWLNGFGVGGAIRWQDEIALGNPLITDEFGNIVPDINNPIMGDAETNIDVWFTYKMSLEKLGTDLRFRFGIKNLNSDEGLIPVNVNPNGEVRTVRIEAPTFYEFTTSISF